MSNQPDEPQGDWTRKHMQALRNGIAAMTTKALGDDEVEAFPYEIIKALGLESQECGVDVLASISALKADLAAAIAANHEQAKSLLVMSEKYRLMAAERDRLARFIDCGLVGERDGCLSGERVCLLCQLADLRKATSNAEKATALAESERNAINEQATEYRNLADRLEVEVERLTHDLDSALELSKMLAQDFEAEEKRLRAQVESLTDNPELDATDAAHPAWWRAHDYTTAIFCQYVNDILDGKDDGSGANGEPWSSTRKRLLALCRQRHAAAEAVKRKAVEITDNQARRRREMAGDDDRYLIKADEAEYVGTLINRLDVAALVGAAQGEWRAIDTAPKDGTRILVWPYWSDGLAAEVAWKPMKRTAGRWEATGGSWVSTQPTHWMPMPTPPVARLVGGFAQEVTKS